MRLARGTTLRDSPVGKLSRIAAKIAYSVIVFAVFGAVAVAIGRSASHDWREGREQRDGVSMFSAVQQWWPAFIAAAVAIGGPVMIPTR